MEDFSNLLWILVVVGSVIASVVSKHNKEKDKNPALPEAFPMPAAETLRSEDEPGNASRKVPAHIPDSQPAKPLVLHSRPQPAWDENPSPDAGRFAPPLAAASSEQAAERMAGTLDENSADMLAEPLTEAQAFAFGTEENASVKPEARAADRTEGARETGLLADFDLRKAVVWSEVLKPKFEEN